MANAALELWRANRSLYGADKLATAMRKAGHDVGRDQVARLMGIVGIEGVRRGKHRTRTTRRDPAAVRHPDLISRAWKTPTRPGPVVGRRLHLRVDTGRVRVHQLRDRRVLPADPGLADLGSRRPPRWSCPPSSRPCSPAAATTPGSAPPRAWCSTPTPGQQYTAISFTEALIDAGIAPSIGTVGDALDNALMESTIGLYKTELIDHDRARSWSGRAEVERRDRQLGPLVQHDTHPPLDRQDVADRVRGRLDHRPPAGRRGAWRDTRRVTDP